MKKKRIRYSELGVSTPVGQAAVTPPAEPLPQPEPALVPAAAQAEPPREVHAEARVETKVAAPSRRVSTPVDLARALAADQAAAEAAARAEAPPEPAIKPEIVELLMFRIGAERFAVELLEVDEVIDLPVIHFVPEMPPAMVGVVSVRGSLTPVYSPHVPLGLPVAQSEAVLIFRHAGSRVGVLIDDVEDAINVDLRELRETPGTHEHDEVVLGVVRHEGALVAIADIKALIAACQSAAVLETA